MTELKPCPFCGRDNHLTMEGWDFGRGWRESIDTETENISIGCDCGCSLNVYVDGITDPDKKEKKAITEWNRRTKQ